MPQKILLGNHIAIDRYANRLFSEHRGLFLANAKNKPVMPQKRLVLYGYLPPDLKILLLINWADFSSPATPRPDPKPSPESHPWSWIQPTKHIF